MRKFLCVHGHFYQPPRENAWLERIDRQESAHPFHDWNARIESECYGPNARARILNGQDRVIAVVNNFAKMSFNIGPTLLSWLERHAPRTYAGILAADRESAELFGQGSAMAQVYSHAIMPLASARDRATQTRWGARDFEHRFGRKPQGMWLAETAADTASLRALADEGIAFTVLSPRQAKTVRLAGKDAHVPVTEATLDTRRPYSVNVGDGKSIAVFFYDGAASQAVAFERLLGSGDAFAAKLAASFSDAPKANELVHIATDGESYGHHHRFGEMALAYALRKIE
ncbi:MAG: glycoside hydrolase, partial [Myxococcales bacterium]|nr:glycoside hydrolase [Myxococcales bacterium]